MVLIPPGPWHCWNPLCGPSLWQTQSRPYKTNCPSMTRHEVGYSCSPQPSVSLQLECHLSWEQGKRMRNMRLSKNFAHPSWCSLFLRCFYMFLYVFFMLFLIQVSNGLYKTTSILVLDHPWFSSLVIYGGMFDILWYGFEWFWMALIPPGPWHCWILSKTPCNKTHQNHTKPTDEKHENFARIWPSHQYYSLFLSVFSPSLYKTTSILVLHYPWFSTV